MGISEIKKNAKESLAKKWSKGVFIVLAFLATSFIIGLIEGIFEDQSIMANIISIISTVIGVPLSFGFTYSFIRLKRGEEVKAFDFLNSGFSNFGKAWKINLRIVLKLIVPIILFVLILLVIAGIIGYSSIELLANDMAKETIFAIITATVVGLAVYCWLVIRSLLYSLTTYIAFDNPNMTSLEIVNESEKMMKGNRKKLFLLSLSFIGWVIVCAFTLGIGSLWLIPYVQVAEVCFYESILEKKDNNVEENEPIIEK